MDTLLTTRRLEDLLQVDRVTIYRMLDDGRLQGFKIGSQWRFSREAIETLLRGQQASLEVERAPTGRTLVLPTPESLPLSCIQAIQGVFAEALGVGTVTTAVDGTPLTGISNCREFCDHIFNTKPGRQRCIASWRRAAPGLGMASSQTDECHVGLDYVRSRIKVRGHFAAATHAGQFLSQLPGDEVWSARIVELSRATGVAASRLRGALTSVPVLDRDKRRQVPRLLARVTETFAEMGEERISLVERLQRIAEVTQI